MSSTTRLRQTLLAAALTLALPALAVAASSGKASSAYAAVDPMIGTGGDGHTFPGATVPFGMVQLSPDTAMPDFKHGYKWAARLSVRRLEHPRFLAYAFLRQRPFRPGRRARHAHRRRREAGPRFPRAAR